MSIADTIIANFDERLVTDEELAELRAWLEANRVPVGTSIEDAQTHPIVLFVKACARSARPVCSDLARANIKRVNAVTIPFLIAVHDLRAKSAG